MMQLKQNIWNTLWVSSDKDGQYSFFFFFFFKLNFEFHIHKQILSW